MAGCYLCDGPICYHGILSVKVRSDGWHYHCEDCGVESIGHRPYCFSLPFYEGRLDFRSRIYFEVCRGCYNRFSRESEELLKI